ncbi:MAG: transcriptional repressor LexA [Chloroflexi bacterium]|nr:transcriptional repressor LexA [Chloroflexota bacterium]
MAKLSQRQQRILEFIREFLQDNGYPPTIRDIQRGCDVSSTSVVDYNLHILQREGHIRRTAEVSRGLELLDGSAEPVQRRVVVPVMGYIAAGQPLPVPSAEGWAQPEPLDTVELPPSYVAGRTKGLYALKVKGLSMVDALIDDGDVVVLSPVTEVRNGDMVVAWLKAEKEATLKRLYAEGNTIRLQPANSQMEPIVTSADNVEVQGKVVTVIRRVG